MGEETGFEPGERVLVVSARIGAGHDGAARELARVFTERGMRVHRVDFLDLLPVRLGRLLLGFYQRQLSVAPRSWDGLLAVLGRPAVTRLVCRFARLAGPRLAEALGAGTTLAVSTYPLASHALAHLKRRGEPVPLLVYLTDPSVHRLCITPDAELTVAPNEAAAVAAVALGAGRTIVHRPLASPAFRPPVSPRERLQMRARFGLPAGGRLVLLTAGSWGVGDVALTAADIADSGLAEPVVVCGRNEPLRDRLRANGFRFVFGWVDAMPELLRACDAMVQNAGGLSTAEAQATGLPVFTYRCLPGHGRANAAVLDAEGIVPWLRSAEELGAALRDCFTAPESRDRAGSAVHAG